MVILGSIRKSLQASIGNTTVNDQACYKKNEYSGLKAILRNHETAKKQLIDERAHLLLEPV